MTSVSRNNHLQPDFVLTPQQQNLLFAALNSGKQPNGSPANGAMTMSPPPSHNDSPLQKTDANGFQESPYLDYDTYDFSADNSFDFSFADDSQAKMIGDLPGTTTDSSKASSDNNDSNEKRPHPDDEEDEEGDAKRRESGDKIPKKPGRKPLTTEPSSVRSSTDFPRTRRHHTLENQHSHRSQTEAEGTEQGCTARIQGTQGKASEGSRGKGPGAREGVQNSQQREQSTSRPG